MVFKHSSLKQFIKILRWREKKVRSFEKKESNSYGLKKMILFIFNKIYKHWFLYINFGFISQVLYFIQVYFLLLK